MQAVAVVVVMLQAGQVAQAVVGRAEQTLLATQGLQTQAAGVAVRVAITLLTQAVLAVQVL
jgi:hypothetical protein